MIYAPALLMALGCGYRGDLEGRWEGTCTLPGWPDPVQMAFDSHIHEMSTPKERDPTVTAEDYVLSEFEMGWPGTELDPSSIGGRFIYCLEPGGICADAAGNPFPAGYTQAEIFVGGYDFGDGVPRDVLMDLYGATEDGVISGECWFAYPDWLTGTFELTR